jgi:hypothetical protein
MVIDAQCQVIFNGKMLDLPVDKAINKVLSAGTSFSGSLEFGGNRALLFNLVNKEDMKYIFKELEKIKSEVRLDIRTNDEIAKGI